MALTITDLSEDILTSGIARYLTPEQIVKFFTLNKALYEIFCLSNTIYQLLYNKKFTNNENNYTLSLRDKINWKQLFNLRCNPKQQVFTWGESNGGRLGYLSTKIDQSNVLKKLGGWSVHTPTNIPEFNNHVVVDLQANGYSFIILLNNGDIWFTGMDWKRPQQGLSTPGPTKERDYKPNPATLALLSMGRNHVDGEILGGRRNLRRNHPTNHLGDEGGALIPPYQSPLPPHGTRFGVLPMPGIAMRYSDSESDEETDTITGPITAAPIPPLPTTNTSNVSEAPPLLSSSSTPQARRGLQSSQRNDLPKIASHSSSKIQETNFLSRLFLPPATERRSLGTINFCDERKVTSISTGREHIVALDNHNNIYTWDTGCNTNVGINIVFRGISKNAIVSKIAAGWNLSACFIQDIGLLVWYTRKPISKMQFENQNFQSEANYLVVPFTKNDIKDFTVGADYVLYVKKSDSKLYQFRFNAHELASRDDSNTVGQEELTRNIYAMDNFNNWLVEQMENVQFTKLKSCFNNFVVFTNHDHVLIGNNEHLLYSTTRHNDVENESDWEPNTENGTLPIVINELQGQDIKSIEIGDYHYLALTNNGDVLSWGTESRSCGCLGIGSRESAVELNPTVCFASGANMDVKIPMRVRDPFRGPLHEGRDVSNNNAENAENAGKKCTSKGKWVCIAASGWHSGGVYVPAE